MGSWSALYRELQHDDAGNASKGDVLASNTTDCLLYAHDRLLVTEGVNDLVIVETADAVLITGKHSSSETGQLAKHLQSLRLTLKPGAILSLQRHQQRSEHWVVVNGQASVVHGDDRIVLNENESTYIPAGMIHQLANMTNEDLEVIEVQTGSYLEEDDIERLDDPYNRGGTAG